MLVLTLPRMSRPLRSQRKTYVMTCGQYVRNMFSPVVKTTTMRISGTKRSHVPPGRLARRCLKTREPIRKPRQQAETIVVITVRC